MSLLREPPERIKIYAMACFLLATALTLLNVGCSYFYFRAVAPGGNGLGVAIAIGGALLINIIETGTTMLFLSGDEMGHLFTPPRITVERFPGWVPKAIKFGIMGIFGLALFWTYRVDLTSTAAILKASGSVGWFLVIGCVFGSEFLMVLGHALWGTAKYSKANTKGLWNAINEQLNAISRPQRPQGQPTQAQQPEQPRQGLADRARRGA